MPTITVHRKDVEALLGTPFDLNRFEDQLKLVKGELDDFDPTTGEVRVELNDTNRPDLWCVEGITRQIATRARGAGIAYPFFAAQPEPATKTIEVGTGLSDVRPHIGACIARGVTVDETLLAQLIQTQEKICDGFGRKRRDIAIGIYAADRIVFPLRYRAVSPEDTRFVPLGMDRELSLMDIVAMHPKGKEYGPLVADHGHWPLLEDAEGTVLSFPPVINSVAVGEVQVGDDALFLEVTGTDARMVALTINILAANMADRGSVIEPVRTVYPDDTAGDRELTLPRDLHRSLTVPTEIFDRALGETVTPAALATELTAYGLSVATEEGAVTVAVPPFRDDILHPIDVVEDYAISRGYDSFAAEMPSAFTVGQLTPTERLSDRVREQLVGLGFQEFLSNLLVAAEDWTDRMERHGARLVTVANPMTTTYSALRNAVLPSLLKVERDSGNAFYPHRLFEVGEVARPDADDPMGSRTETHVAALLAHVDANFSELAASLEMMAYYLGTTLQLDPLDHASYIPGRAGRVTLDGWEVGIIGELSPQVLENWGITVPCTAFECNLSALLPH